MEKKKGRKALKVIGIVLGVLVLLSVGWYILYVTVVGPLSDYNYAKKTYQQGKFRQAAYLFEKLGDYKDSPDQVLICLQAEKDKKLADAVALFDTGAYADGFAALDKLQDEPRAEEEKVRLGGELTEQASAAVDRGDLQAAWEILRQLPMQYTDRDLQTWVEVTVTDFEDGEMHDLASLYERILAMQSWEKKQELLTLPQFRTVEMLTGFWYLCNNGRVNPNVSITVVLGRDPDNKLNTRYLRYRSGEYYFYFQDDDTYRRWYEITSTGFTEEYVSEGEQKWVWKYCSN